MNPIYRASMFSMDLVPPRKCLLAATVLTMAFFLFCGTAMAWTVPAAGSFAYSLYDFGVNKILKGPAGFIGGVGMILWAATMLPKGAYLQAGATALAGGLLASADTITGSMGMII